MLHPHTELRHVSEEIGYGVFTTKFIPKGTITWVRDELDQSFAPHEILTFRKEYQDLLEKYTFIDHTGQAVLCWDLARYMNHSCDANCLGAGYEFEIAIRDIQAGEELTDDYGTLNLRDLFPCFCRHAHCRKTIRPDDLSRLWEEWDAKLRSAFPLIGRINQPLIQFVRDRAEIEEVMSSPAKMRSCRFNYYPRLFAEQAVRAG
jgi:SET domain-containing protein